ncbi:hypothetical protein GUJ93_ZPchr0004g40097 [Zizania palustris]|uniref:Uncharacterized protein n=1 Tax=Zizania palustris TaxID=103762 RepID=A0A8J5SD79_ZIZPA|nr:hypothetical protein GUJ93_ZPchr0004g40097 [Zizania palustris]
MNRRSPALSTRERRGAGPRANQATTEASVGGGRVLLLPPRPSHGMAARASGIEHERGGSCLARVAMGRGVGKQY